MNSCFHPEVTAAIINYGSPGDATELVNRLAGEVAATFVVDNSNDLDDSFSSVGNTCVIKPGKNLGFGAAVNLAADKAESRWLLILNPDVRLKRHCLSRLVEASRDLHAPLCGPRFYWDDACTFQLPPALGHPLWLLSDHHVPNMTVGKTPNISAMAIVRHERFWQERAPFSEPVLSGACLLVDNHWFRQNKMPIFDEDFFLYYEDTDLCGRLMRKGVIPVCVAGANAVHYWNQSSEPPESKTRLMRDSEKLFLEKYYPNGAPPMPSSGPSASFEELGVFSSSPVLPLPVGTDALDLGVQEDFIVFARTTIRKSEFTFSSPIWKRLRPGPYLLRAMDATGNPLQYWRLEKQG